MGIVRHKAKVLLLGLTFVLSGLVATLPSSVGHDALAQVSTFIETFDGTPPVPTSYTNPSNWNIFVQGFDGRQPGQQGGLGHNAQHGPNCEPPGFPYTATNSHLLRSVKDTVFICNGHLMTAPGLSGYAAIYMTPPAVVDFSGGVPNGQGQGGAGYIRWDMSTLRTSGRDWVDIVLTPWRQHSDLAYNNNDQHIPPQNIHISLAGTNVFLVTQRVNGGTQFGQGQDVQIPGDTFTTWDDVMGRVGLSEDAARREHFEIRLTRTTISVCMPGYQQPSGGVFCWLSNAPLAQPLSPSVWNDQASVMFSHRVYNAEKACIDAPGAPAGDDDLDEFNVDHSPYGDRTCPPNTWHWDNMSLTPYVSAPIIKSVPEQVEVNTANATTVNFAQAAPAGAYLQFVAFSHTPDLRVSYNGGSTWVVPSVQPANAPNNGASEENGEAFFTPIPLGTSSIRIRGSNGFWGTFQASDFSIFVPPTGTPINATPTAVVPTPTSTATATATSTTMPTATATATATRTPTGVVTVASQTPTATAIVATTTATPTRTATASPTNTDTPTPVPTATSTSTAVATATPTATATVEATVVPTPSVTPTPSTDCEVEVWILGVSFGRRPC